MNDIPDSELKKLATYYGISDKKFSGFLGSLGLRDSSGRPKMSFSVLSQQAKLRGW
jgi:hypothetical protein